MISFDLATTNVWVGSDFHYNHKNICKGTSSWEDKSGCRDFDTLDKMNQAIVDGINNNVQQDDVLISLGDWSFGGIENIWNFRKRIICKNIYHLYGNHDEHIKNNKILPNCHIRTESNIPYDGGIQADKVNYCCFTEHLFTFLGDTIEFTVRRTVGDSNKLLLNFFCSHYSHRIWNKSHKGVMHLYGHSHSTLEHLPHGKSMDAGIDNAFRLFGEYRPFNILEVYDILKKREIKFIDGHNEKTN